MTRTQTEQEDDGPEGALPRSLRVARIFAENERMRRCLEEIEDAWKAFDNETYAPTGAVNYTRKRVALANAVLSARVARK